MITIPRHKMSLRSRLMSSFDPTFLLLQDEAAFDRLRASIARSAVREVLRSLSISRQREQA